jgi:hypothetical protein
MTARLARIRNSLNYSVERLARDLAEEGELAEQDENGSILLRAGIGETWDPPARLVVTDDDLRRHLLSMANDAKDVFPEVDAVQAAYQLFLIHLDEELATSAVAGSRITIGPRGLDVDPVREPDPWADADVSTA